MTSALIGDFFLQIFAPFISQFLDKKVTKKLVYVIFFNKKGDIFKRFLERKNWWAKEYPRTY